MIEDGNDNRADKWWEKMAKNGTYQRLRTRVDNIETSAAEVMRLSSNGQL